jgi:hypothetical protein
MSAPNSRLNHAWVHDELARSSEPSRARESFTLGTQLGGVTLVQGGSRRFAESHLASGRKIVLDADTMFIPDPILPWVKSARLRKQGIEVCSCLGGGEQTGGDAETRVSGAAELAAPRHPAGP